MGRLRNEIMEVERLEFESAAERREFERYPIKIPAMIELAVPEGMRTLILKSSNISARGVYFVTDKPFPENSRVRINFVLHFSRAGKAGREKTILIKITGRVLRSERSGMAVTFDEDYQIMNIKPGKRGNAAVH